MSSCVVMADLTGTITIVVSIIRELIMKRRDPAVRTISSMNQCWSVLSI